MLDEVDVIFAILNVAGLGIRGGSRTDMENALRFAREMGKGVYIMKALGGGHLYREARKALEYARDFPHKDSVAVGLHTRSEVEFAVRVFSGERTSTESASEGESKRRLIVEDWCEGCGECVKVCGFGALTLSDGTAQVDTSKCMLCGYCARVCPHFCLKVV
jgi:ferredoxin